LVRERGGDASLRTTAYESWDESWTISVPSTVSIWLGWRAQLCGGRTTRGALGYRWVSHARRVWTPRMKATASSHLLHRLYSHASLPMKRSRNRPAFSRREPWTSTVAVMHCSVCGSGKTARRRVLAHVQLCRAQLCRHPPRHPRRSSSSTRTKTSMRSCSLQCPPGGRGR
jgi:hypothetical protein